MQTVKPTLKRVLCQYGSDNKEYEKQLVEKD